MMTVQEATQAIGTLGISVVMIVAFMFFFYKRMWPELMQFMRSFTEVLSVNSKVMQEISDTNRELANVVRSNSPADLLKQTAILIEKMDVQHIGLSQQMAAQTNLLVSKVDVNRERMDEILRKLDK